MFTVERSVLSHAPTACLRVVSRAQWNDIIQKKENITTWALCIRSLYPIENLENRKAVVCHVYAERHTDRLRLSNFIKIGVVLMGTVSSKQKLFGTYTAWMDASD